MMRLQGSLESNVFSRFFTIRRERNCRELHENAASVQSEFSQSGSVLGDGFGRGPGDRLWPITGIASGFCESVF